MQVVLQNPVSFQQILAMRSDVTPRPHLQGLLKDWQNEKVRGER